MIDSKIMIPALFVIVPISVFMGWPEPSERREERVAGCENSLQPINLPSGDVHNLCNCMTDEEIDRGVGVIEAARMSDGLRLEILDLCIARHNIEGIV